MIRAEPAKGMVLADLACVRLVEKPVAVLVLCPGYNQNAKNMVEQAVWQDFAKSHRLALAGLSFSSPESLLVDKEGYYVARKGSGDCLIQAIEQGFKVKNLPIFLYGFSGGAHFAGAFAEWKPERVRGWCAYSAAWWDKPEVKDDKNLPPGVIGCGQLDRYRLGASLLYFKQGRSLGRPWLWMELKGEDHSWSEQMNSFVREYFSLILNSSKKQPVFVDLESEEIASVPLLPGHESLYGWLPDSRLFESWKKIHQP